MTCKRTFAAIAALVVFGCQVSFTQSAQAAERAALKQWHLRYLKAVEANSVSAGSGVTVAVIDSGVSSHPDLKGSVLSGVDLVGTGGSGTTDVSGHGTMMAGLIAAHGKSESGAQGIAPESKILPIRVGKEDPDQQKVGEAIDYAVAHGAKVINLSVGGSLTPALIEAVAAAKAADVVMIAAAGNRATVGNSVTPLASEPGVVAVGAVDDTGKVPSFSVTGPEVDLVAPGVDIEGLNKGGEYWKVSGTSPAAAIVSGAAALVRSRYPGMSAEEVVERLESTATDKGAPGVDDAYGHGVIDVVAALSGGDGRLVAASPTAAVVGDAGDSSGGRVGLLVGGGVLVVLLVGAGFYYVRRSRARAL
jgi:type VII secretion-associated serine protease mycosin